MVSATENLLNKKKSFETVRIRSILAPGTQESLKWTRPSSNKPCTLPVSYGIFPKARTKANLLPVTTSAWRSDSSLFKTLFLADLMNKYSSIGPTVQTKILGLHLV